MPLSPEAQKRLEHLDAMILILGSVVSRLGQMSDYIAGHPSLPMILEWQMGFSEQIAELRKLIDKDFLEDQLVSTVTKLSEKEEEEDEEEGAEGSPGDYLVVEDKTKPSTWHLRVKRNGKPDRNLAGAAWAALFSPNGFRGNKYEGPQKLEARRKLKALYKSMKWELPNA